MTVTDIFAMIIGAIGGNLIGWSICKLIERLSDHR